jgi:hypothetical protein
MVPEKFLRIEDALSTIPIYSCECDRELSQMNPKIRPAELFW